ncbi:formate dehydrogenase accessory sulfurtransferase FdhD [Halobacillus sp. KGW1]|uniref:formate dehydrogenase accessory sulfurtransferase FdhD n=1 Tax=Halobacillus sp. KGW1 TaxID=1793726 RepID=UPI0007863326|nr:formate dehydrogenase accessory sulfurtransferase FdhD [Halobacillus sp. KGW1]
METTPWTIDRYEGEEADRKSDIVAVEYPLTIFINGNEFATMVCTPIDLEVLVTGFLASEGLIRKADEIKKLTIDMDRGIAYAETHRPIAVSGEGQKRWIGSCCGKSRAFYFKNDAATARTAVDDTAYTPDTCFRMMDAFHREAETFRETGGVHQAAIAKDGKLVKAYTDIGRHNALDKLYGYLLMERMEHRGLAVLFSGRISSEVLLKVSKMRIGFLLSKSAPTDLALQLAEDLHITAVGFVRGRRMNVYTHPSRIKESSKGGVSVE